MESEKHETAPGPSSVELVCVPARADMAEALRARTGPPVPWRTPLAAGLIMVALLAVLLMLAAPRGVLAGTAAGVAVVVAVQWTVLGGLAIGWGKQRYRVRRLTTYVRSHGRFTMRADEDGVHTATALMESRIPWTSFRHYVETANLFLLIIDDTVGGMVVLPKRGLCDGADVDVMREVISRYLPPPPSGG